MDVPASVIVMAGVAGLIFGSFLNVCIARLPRDQSIVRPRSRCPNCETPIPWYDNIPVVSWFALGGRCRTCKVRISLVYPLIELAVAVLWMGAVRWYGLSVHGATAALFGTILLGIAVTDAQTYLIPNEYTLGGLALGLLLSVFGGLDGVLRALLGAGVGFGLLYLVAVGGEKLFRKEAMGGGDIKMMAMVGAFVGWQGVPLTIFGGALLGTVVFVPLQMIRAGVAKARGREAKEMLVPFGVFLAAAAGLTFVFGEYVMDWYVAYVLAGS